MKRWHGVLGFVCLLGLTACGDSTMYWAEGSENDQDSVYGEEPTSGEEPIAGEEPTDVEPMTELERWGGRDVSAELAGFDSCDVDSSCVAGSVCRGFCIPESETPGAFGGACLQGGSGCNEGLSCSDSVCVDPILEEGYYRSLALTPEEFYGGQLPDFAMRGQFLGGAVEIKSAVNLRDTGFLPRPANQGRHGSCLGFAAGYGAATYVFAERDGNNVSRASASSEHVLSPAYLYNKSRELGGFCGKSGSRPTEAIQTLRKFGIPSGRSFPYKESVLASCNTNMSSTAAREAADHTISSARDLFRPANFNVAMGKDLIADAQLNAIKAELSQGRPVVMSIRTPSEFFKMRSKTPLASPLTAYRVKDGEVDHGLHAILAVGYNEGSKTLRILNSWGTSWGDRGEGNLSYEAARKTIYQAWVMIPAAPTTPAVEIRMEWDDDVDLDMFLEEPGVGTYSYRGVPGNAGRFENHQSCRNGNAYCSTMYTSIEKVTWEKSKIPTSVMQVEIKKSANHSSSVPVRLVVEREGEVVAERDFTITGDTLGKIPIELF